MAGASILYGIEKALETFLRTICDDYGLPYEEAHSRYFLPTGEAFEKAVSNEIDTSEIRPVVSVEPKNKGKAKVVSTSGSVDKMQCTALTTKKTQCKKFALGGSNYCSCHQNYTDNDEASSSKAKPMAKGKGKTKGKGKSKGTVDHDEVVSEEEIDEPDAIDRLLNASGISTDGECSTSTPKAKATKSKVPPAPKKPQVKHSHPIDEELHEDCDVCSETGNAAAEDPEEYEIKNDVRSRLASILAQVSEEDSETDDE